MCRYGSNRGSVSELLVNCSMYCSVSAGGVGYADDSCIVVFCGASLDGKFTIWCIILAITEVFKWLLKLDWILITR